MIEHASLNGLTQKRDAWDSLKMFFKTIVPEDPEVYPP
jgi:hypothetical protein